MKNLAIIPARGGSKRIPRKNIRDFLGKPIIAYSIEVALKSKLFDEVMVSTDDVEIADVAKKYEAKVPFMRSEANSDDFASTVEVLLEVLDDYERIGKTFDNVCCIYPTAPFITVQDLRSGYRLLEDATSVLPVVEFEFPILRAFKKNENGYIEYAWPEYENSRSQDLDSFYHDAGQWYWMKVSSLLELKTLITPKTKSIIKSPLTVQDIDKIDDWKIAELKYINMEN